MGLVTRGRFNAALFGGAVVMAIAWTFVLAVALYLSFWWFYLPQYRQNSYFSVNYGAPGDFPAAVLSMPALALESEDYAVQLELELPRSQHNVEVGNFMTEITFCDQPPPPGQRIDDWLTSLDLRYVAMGPDTVERDVAGKALSIKQMSILPFRSELVEIMDTFVYAPLYVLGLKEQVSTIRIDLLSKVSLPTKRYHFAIVSMNKPVELVSASLVWTVQLWGLKRLMHDHPLLSFFAGTAFVWFWELLCGLTITIVYVARASADPAAQVPVGAREGQASRDPAVRLSPVRSSAEHTSAIRHPVRRRSKQAKLWRHRAFNTPTRLSRSRYSSPPPSSLAESIIPTETSPTTMDISPQTTSTGRWYGSAEKRRHLN